MEMNKCAVIGHGNRLCGHWPWKWIGVAIGHGHGLSKNHLKKYNGSSQPMPNPISKSSLTPLK
jgi:hypothetical protein